ncbi:MAG: transposase [Holosporales bacterium]|nr:transposase [Holosporales bacterium]
MSYSVDLRKRVVEFVQGGGRKIEASRRFRVSRSVVYDWLRLQEKSGYLEKIPYKRRVHKVDAEILKAYVLRHPDHYLHEISSVFHCTPSGIFRALKRLHLTLKKKPPITKSAARP